MTRFRLRGHFHTENIEDREEQMRPQRWDLQTGHIDRDVVTSQLRLVVEICDREKGKLGWDPQGRSAWWCIWDQRSHRSFGRSLSTWVNPWRFENQGQPSPGRKLVQIVSKRKKTRETLHQAVVDCLGTVCSAFDRNGIASQGLLEVRGLMLETDSVLQW